MICPARPLPIDFPEPASGPIPDEAAEIVASLLLEAVDRQEAEL